LVRQLDDDIRVVEDAFADALGENRTTLSLSFEKRQRAFYHLADIVEGFANNPLWSVHPLAGEMYEHAQQLRIACADANASSLDIEWLLYLRRLMPMVGRELAHQLLTDPAEAALYLIEELRGGEAGAVRSILDTSLRTLRAWLDHARAPRSLDPERLVLVAQLVFDLRREREREDIISWFLTANARLRGVAPVALLENSRASAAVLLAAAGL
jgi:hypothetical protein